MDKWFKLLNDKLQALSLRERWLLALASAGLGFLLLDLLLLSPQNHRQQSLRNQLAQQAAEIKVTAAALTAARQSPASAPASAGDQHLSPDIDAALTGLESIRGQRDFELRLDSLLNRHSDVSLQSLKIQATRPLISAAEMTGLRRQQQASGVVAVPIEVIVKGPYPALQALLSELEAASPDLYWSELKLQAAYPDTTLRLLIYQLTRSAGAT